MVHVAARESGQSPKNDVAQFRESSTHSASTAIHGAESEEKNSARHRLDADSTLHRTLIHAASPTAHQTAVADVDVPVAAMVAIAFAAKSEASCQGKGRGVIGSEHKLRAQVPS